ncbi:hypothetical protein M409DRAFT_56224 [Zasmidium cellare ATCC 36951]|uniref:Uncharacterized protein n=1 Tax=Zasmidium cellare ATCC 36951 TaxID=1080233 RepID=A0A6A6CCE1_ZASCE|nr:uncharacterized protein M409DRAFT_56224 [Zasmidium cellare ATCC 36951]KAF2164854.1 hypothetical protein M409DRAFT_56224 [Zasmidium cellare ATCC 36951]
MSSSPYNLRKSSLPSAKARNLSTYMQDLYTEGRTASPRKRHKLANELIAIMERRRARSPSISDATIMVANEIVSVGRPPEWHIARHQMDLFQEWEEAMGITREDFERDVEFIPWLGIEDAVPKMMGQFGVVDMVGPIQGRSLTAKRLDGKEMGPERVPSVEEMSWREWRRLSRACNLLLEAVDGLPWGWEMEDAEWEAFSRAGELFNGDQSRDLRELSALYKWENA